MQEAVILSACRTPIGEFNGSLKEQSATQLGALVINEAIDRAKIDPNEVDEVIMGCVLPYGLGQNPARQAGLIAKLPYKVECLTVNKVCGSGLKAVMLAAQAVMLEDAAVVVAGGMENMNRCPYFLPNARSGYRMGTGQIIDGMVHDGLWDHLNGFHMGFSAELIAEKYQVSREKMDKLAANSYQKTLQAQNSGKFEAEIVPVPLPQRKGEPILFSRDETPRETSLDTLASLRPAFKKDGTVTAGNSSKISDGASAVVVTTAEKARELGVEPIARIIAQAAAAQDPKDVLVTPILSIPKTLKKAGLSPNDVDLHEINEAFSVSTVAIIETLSISEEKLNVHGGAIALGHPIGASGTRVLTTLLYALEDRKQKIGMASLCLGGGEAVSLLVERLQ